MDYAAALEQNIKEADQTVMFDEIYESYYKRVYNYISYRINDHYHTEELVSRVFEKVLLKLDTYCPGKAPMEVWIITIARNTITDYYRERQKNQTVSLDTIVDLFSSRMQPEQIAVANEQNRNLIAALNTLKKRDREIIAMKYAAELRNTDIARITGLSETNVGAIISRSIRRLRTEMERLDQGGE